MIAKPNEGILVAPYDEVDFARQLVALAKNEARLTDMQQAVIQKAKTYTIERSGKAWEEMLQYII